MNITNVSKQTMVSYCLIIWLIGALVLLSSPLQVSAQEEGFDEVYAPSVYWQVNLDIQGRASTDLTIMVGEGGTDLAGAQPEIIAALEEALHCSFENLEPEVSKRRWKISANCRIAVRQEGLLKHAQLQPSALWSLTEKYGLGSIGFTLMVPKPGVSSGLENAHRYSSGRIVTYSTSFKPADKTSGDISLEFGYPRSYVIALLGTTLFLLVAPIVLVLVIRRRSLLLAGKDATAAWFGYWRVHRWISEGIWIVWIIVISLFNAEIFIEFLAGRDSSVLIALVQLVPPGIVSFACQYLSRPLWLQVRGVAWNRREMLIRGFWQHAAAILPWAFIIIGIGSIFRNSGMAMLWFAAAFIALLFGSWMNGKITKTTPRPFMSGELREKILEMAQRAGVKIEQVFMMPSKELQMGNAFAMQGRRVMITDYLLDRLTKRETDCVMAHEIGHVKKRHALLLSWVGVLIIFALIHGALLLLLTMLPAFFSGITSMNAARMLAVQSWMTEYLLFPFALILAVMIRYFLSRRFERSADEFATLVTGDPESMITALVKLSKMNLMPISWGSLDEHLSTHPSTMRRTNAIAERHRIPRDRLRVLLETPASRPEGEGYTVPDEISNTELVYSTEFRTHKTLLITLFVLLSVSTTPLIWGRFAGYASIPAAVSWAGLPLMPLVFLAVANYGSLFGYGKMKRGMREKAVRLGMDPNDEHPFFVGLSPEPNPRNYENHTVWDIGFLSLTSDDLVYYGDRVRFRIPRNKITSITKGKAYPGWFGITETYIRWNENGQERVLHLHSIDGSSMTAIAKRSESLLLDLMNWKDGRFPGRQAQVAEASLGLPVLPDVKGIHPRQTTTIRGLLSSLLFVALLIFGLSGLFSLDSSLSWYGFGMSSWCLLFGSLPSMTYKED